MVFVLLYRLTNEDMLTYLHTLKQTFRLHWSFFTGISSNIEMSYNILNIDICLVVYCSVKWNKIQFTV